MIKLEQISETFPDETANYSVEFSKVLTVDEFIKDVLKRKEWGYIAIKDTDGHSIFGNPLCEYRGDKLITELPKEILTRTIIGARASGGWSRMDYILNIIEE